VPQASSRALPRPNFAMVRVIASFPALVAVVSTLSAAEQEAGGLSMQLHRLPKHDVHPERYARRLNTEDDAPELVPLHLGLGCVALQYGCMAAMGF
jgi:hypothetical protein